MEISAFIFCMLLSSPDGLRTQLKARDVFVCDQTTCYDMRCCRDRCCQVIDSSKYDVSLIPKTGAVSSYDSPQKRIGFQSRLVLADRPGRAEKRLQSNDHNAVAATYNVTHGRCPARQDRRRK